MNDEKFLADFVKERNEALFSLDEKKIRAYSRKYKVPMSKHPTVFWASVYKAIANITNAPEDLKAQAEEWLDSHGFSREVEMPRY